MIFKCASQVDSTEKPETGRDIRIWIQCQIAIHTLVVIHQLACIPIFASEISEIGFKKKLSILLQILHQLHFTVKSHWKSPKREPPGIPGTPRNGARLRVYGNLSTRSVSRAWYAWSVYLGAWYYPWEHPGALAIRWP